MSPLSLRLDPGVTARLDKCAEKTGLKKYTLALLAIEAAVRAIERNNYKIVCPIEFDVTHEAVEKRLSNSTSGNPETQAKKASDYPAHQPQHVELNEKPAKKKKAA